jgi:hypothetical protein
VERHEQDPRPDEDGHERVAVEADGGARSPQLPDDPRCGRRDAGRIRRATMKRPGGQAQTSAPHDEAQAENVRLIRTASSLNRLFALGWRTL